MSELEIIARLQYKTNRKKWIMIQIIVIIVMLFLSLGSFMIFNALNKTYYIEYTECGSIDYKVQYKENEFFEEEWLEKDQAYISSLMENVKAEFKYELNMNANNVDFDYYYMIDSKLLVADKTNGNSYYTLEENVIPKTQKSTARSIGVSVNETIDIDYNKYNAIATSFEKTYGLKNATSTLIVTLKVEVLSKSESFEENNENTYTISLNIPLVAETFSMHTTSSAPQSESKILSYKNSGSTKVFYIIGIVFAVTAALLIMGLFAYMHFTTNEDITYSAKIRKLTNAYGSFIQRMYGDFDSTGYQAIEIKTFNEMLNIRDTLQRPILMSENKEFTKTTFLIPTDNNLLYVFEIKVDNYDELYPEEDD